MTENTESSKPSEMSKFKKVQRQPLSLGQLKTALHLQADGFIIPQTAMLSKQKFSMFLSYVEDQLAKARKPKL